MTVAIGELGWDLNVMIESSVMESDHTEKRSLCACEVA